MQMNYLEIAYHDVIWFACDTAGHIIAASSREGNVPDFVEKDKERAEKIAQRLMGVHAIDRCRVPPVDYAAWAQNGYFFFRGDDPYDGDLYLLCAKPEKALSLDDLDEDMRILLEKQILPINAKWVDQFSLADFRK